MTKLLTILCLIFLPTFWGCAGKEVKDAKPAQVLAEEGMAEFNNEDYRKSILTFGKLKDWYPFSKLATVAELKIADANYHIREYQSAIMAYQEFENLHPTNEAIPYVIYQIGRCWFDQMNTIDRDQTYARKALESFRRLRRQFPEDAYAVKAGEHIDVCQRSLAEHEYYVGVFYFKGKHYKAALGRFNGVLTRYPDVGVHRKALEYIAKCEEKIKNEPEAPTDD
jgi:outer membrane protein assembly factor BamD